MALSWKVIRIFMACNPEKEWKKHRKPFLFHIILMVMKPVNL